MSFLKDKDKKESSLWDWVILAGLVLGGISFWFYYDYQKSKTTEFFQQADSLFVNGKYQEAMDLYEELKEFDYKEPRHDSILNERLDSLFLILQVDQ